MLKFVSFRSLVAFSFFVVFAVSSSGKLAADDKRTFTIWSIEMADAFVEQRLKQASFGIRSSLRQAGVKRRSKPSITKNAVSVTVSRPEDFDVAKKALSKLVRNTKVSGADGAIEIFALETDQKTGSFTLSLTPDFFEKSREDMALRAARKVLCHLRDSADVAMTSATTVVIWAKETVDIQTIASYGACGQSAPSIHEVNFKFSQSKLAAGVTLPDHKTLPDSATANWLWLIKTKPVVSSGEVLSVTPAFDSQTGAGVLAFRFSSTGGHAFEAWTARNSGYSMAVVVDDKVVTAPTGREPISGGAMQITTNLPPDENGLLAAQLDPILWQVQFEQIATCEKTRADLVKKLSC